MAKRKPTLYYIELDYGCCIESHDSNSVAKASKDILRCHGTDNVRLITLATQENVDWVSSMGGRVPDGVVRG